MIVYGTEKNILKLTPFGIFKTRNSLTGENSKESKKTHFSCCEKFDITNLNFKIIFRFPYPFIYNSVFKVSKSF